MLLASACRPYLSGALVKDLKLVTCNAHWHTCIICMHPCFVCTRTSRDMYCMYAELVQVSCRKILLLPMVRMHASSRPDACALVYIHSDVKILFWVDPSHEIMWREGRKHFVSHACPARSYCACMPLSYRWPYPAEYQLDLHGSHSVHVCVPRAV